jgi:hypothetical protein
MPSSRSASTSGSTVTVPSGCRTIGGGCPAFDQRSRVTPAAALVGGLLEPGHDDGGGRVDAQRLHDLVDERRTSAGPSPVLAAMPRSRPRTCPMAAAATVSWPMTSPMTIMVAPSGWRNASYQSPPTCAACAAGW